MLSSFSQKTHSEREYVQGGAVRVYQTEKYKIGVLVGEDLFCNDYFRALSLCDADLIVNVTDNVSDNIPPLMAKARAYEYGIPVVLCAFRFGMLANVCGEAEYISNSAVSRIKISFDKSYKCVVRKERGIK